MGDPEVLDDRYELGPVVGRGGMGVVRRAQDRRLNRTVAVKLLSVQWASDPVARRRFEEEAISAAKISHRSVVTGQVFFGLLEVVGHRPRVGGVPGAADVARQLTGLIR